MAIVLNSDRTWLSHDGDSWTDARCRRLGLFCEGRILQHAFGEPAGRIDHIDVPAPEQLFALSLRPQRQCLSSRQRGCADESTAFA